MEVGGGLREIWIEERKRDRWERGNGCFVADERISCEVCAHLLVKE